MHLSLYRARNCLSTDLRLIPVARIVAPVRYRPQYQRLGLSGGVSVALIRNMSSTKGLSFWFECERSD